MKDNSLFFMVLALGCVWLVLDDFYGNSYLSQFIVKVVPKAEDTGESWWTKFTGKKEEA